MKLEDQSIKLTQSLAYENQSLRVTISELLSQLQSQTEKSQSQESLNNHILLRAQQELVRETTAIGKK